MLNVDLAGEKGFQQVHGPDQNGGGNVILHLLLLPAEQGGHVVHLQNHMLAHQLVRDGQEWEQEAHHFKGG